ncbi:pseudouridine synthase [Candidatus Parcubacteria bacterium]|nr:MAG: pseudouridine synthase [Candidatus Parcubacteria bacterium]
MSITLQKYIVDAGFCSRRKATELIQAGRVFVNGKKAELGQRVNRDDLVEIDGEKLNIREKNIYIKLNKPSGYTCTSKKFSGEKNVFDLVDRDYGKLHIVGRLDKDSRGLVILTSDGDFTYKMTHPSNEHEKEYEVEIMDSNLTADGEFVDMIIHKFMNGVDIGEDGGVVKARNIQEIDKNKFKIILTQGKKRQIRRMFSKLGCVVEDLKRTRIGNVKLDDLKSGMYQEFEL